jgi:hypothetical protein
MRPFLYRFGFETPQQASDNELLGWDHEDSQAIWIIAPSEEVALNWGRAVSERFCAHLFNVPSVSWKSGNFAHWIEAAPESKFTHEDLERIPVIQCGEFPDFAKWA